MNSYRSENVSSSFVLWLHLLYTDPTWPWTTLLLSRPVLWDQHSGSPHFDLVQILCLFWPKPTRVESWNPTTASLSPWRPKYVSHSIWNHWLILFQAVIAEISHGESICLIDLVSKMICIFVVYWLCALYEMIELSITCGLNFYCPCHFLFYYHLLLAPQSL